MVTSTSAASRSDARRWQWVPDLVAAAALLSAAAAKGISGYDPMLGISLASYWVLAGFETVCAAGILLGGRWRRRSLLAAAALCVAGTIWVFWFAHRPCGCFGSDWLPTKAMHTAMASALGLTCLLSLAGDRYARRPSPSGVIG